MRILVIKLGAIGDVIRTTSILPGLKNKYKNCKIDWVAKKESIGALNGNKFIEKIYILQNNSNNRLKNKKYDLIISLDDDYKACRLASEINSKNIIGAYLKNNKKTYTKDSSLWFDMGLLSRFGKQKADLLKAENNKTYQQIIYLILNLKYEKQVPILVLDRKSLGFGKKFAKKHDLKKADLVVGINTGAGGRWQDKKLSVKQTAELIDKINENIDGAKLILFGGPEEKERNNDIKQSVKTRVIDAGCGNSLMKFASLVNLCSILVTSDSLALHIGVALKKKIVAFFAPTSSAEIELYSRGIKILPKKGCLCCYKSKCRIPPEWDIDEIVKAVKKLVSK